MNSLSKVGYNDAIMSDVVSEDAFVDNLKKRFEAGLIYTYIGEQIVSVNPYRKLDIYNDKVLQSYKQMYTYEVDPHIFAIGDDTFRSLITTKNNQCVIITGESGAGKTEASKIFMQYIAAISSSTGAGESIKSKLLSSNPVLEAFGNAKTLRNDNSSRFGKYMEIQFDAVGTPLGGKISQFLLEKSRVVTRAKGERNYHIFYGLLSNPKLAKELHLGEASSFEYLRSSDCYKVNTINDVKDFDEVCTAMSNLGWTEDQKLQVWKVLAAVLFLGNVKFAPDTTKETVDAVVVANPEELKKVSDALDCDYEALALSLTQRAISTGVGKRSSTIAVYLNEEQAYFTRDALAKGLYDKIFSGVVDNINNSIISTGNPEIVIGVLDIYGFEIFEHNSFEQLCINYCNEKLQQLFIKLVLKQEQEEYVREGIKWTEIDFFNNEPICKLIEGTPSGIYKMLDEACMVGKATPESLLEKFHLNFKGNPHYKILNNKELKAYNEDALNKFCIKHYAGDVIYDVTEFMDKNSDTLFHTLSDAMRTSSMVLLSEMFPKAGYNNKRPLTSGTKFKNNVNDLINTLAACQPHYIRCIKSNDNKRGQFLDMPRVIEQVRYLNLVETVRVRKAGFVTRQHYTRFLTRYKMLGKGTWPLWRGSEKDGVCDILNSVGIEKDEYELGKTKVFVRNAKSLFKLEEQRTIQLPKVVILIQKTYRGFYERKNLEKILEKRRLQAKANKIQMAYLNYRCRTFITELLNTYHDAKTADNAAYGRDYPTVHWAERSGATDYIKRIHRCYWAHLKVSALTPEEQQLVRDKVLAMSIFSGNKPWDSKRQYLSDYLSTDNNPRKEAFGKAVQVLFQKYGDTKVLFADEADKVNKRCKSQIRAIVLTDVNIFKYDSKKYVIHKTNVPICQVEGVYLSKVKDTFVILKIQAPRRDLLLNFGISGDEKVSEFVTQLYKQYEMITGNKLTVEFVEKVDYNNARDESGKKESKNNCTVSFQEGSSSPGSIFKKGKGGHNFVQYASN